MRKIIIIFIFMLTPNPLINDLFVSLIYKVY